MSKLNEQAQQERLAKLYAQRKAQHKMPNALKADILNQLGSESTKPNWRRPPIWATTLAACFVIVLSIQFLPPFSQDADYPELEVKDIAKGSPTLEEWSYSPGIPETKQRALPAPTAQVQKARERLHKPVKLESPRMAEVEVDEKALEAMFELNQEQLEDAGVKNKSKAAAPLLNDVTGAVVVKAQLLPQEQNEPRKAKDCYGGIIELNTIDIGNIADNQWVDIHYRDDGSIMRIIKIENFKGCDK